ncbi:MAG TPA: tRNA dihydrouridine(20/20a) synthase DusA [Candidatus Competibacteraceae bacterium]|nr:tRNA dihydrouridine(20/20a) synthase DusA [Candidatus Competibacteraceae bacterium]
MLSRRLSVAPMMDWTDRHCRFFHRLLSRHTLLYTEMVTSAAVLHGDRERLLAFHPDEHPVALQLGGCEPAELAACARIAAECGYDELNLNVGCPSDRVQEGRFGACLMAEPQRVAECVAAMRAAVSIPVTVKCRIGIDERDSYAELCHFVDCLRRAGLETLIVHARKAWLQGLSPKENRELPPLRYEVVHQLKRDFPELEIIINGGILDLDQAQAQLRHVDGVMIGRAAYHDPYRVLAEADRRLYGDPRPPRSRHEVVRALLPYVERHLAQGGRLAHVTRHILGLFQGLPGARAWRRHLSEHAHRPGAGVAVIEAALARIPAEMDAPV